MIQSRRSLDSSLPRGSQYVDGSLVHEATQQKLFFSTRVCTIYREILEKNEQFLRTSAEYCMQKNMRKRQTHAVMNMLEDRFTLEKRKKTRRDPFRLFLFYREIFDIRRSPTRPEYFVLSVDSEVSGKRYYEVYKCKNREDAQKVETLIKRSLEDRGNIVRSENYVDMVPVPVPVHLDSHRSVLHVDFDGSVSSLADDNRQPSVPYAMNHAPPSESRSRPTTASPITVIQRPQLAAAKPTSPSVQREIAVYTSAPSPISRRRSPSLYYSLEKDANHMKGDVTYLIFDGKTRNVVVSEKGPIYMVCDRQDSTKQQPSLNGSINNYYDYHGSDYSRRSLY